MTEDGPGDLPASARKVRQALAALGHDCRIVMFDASTRTAADAAAAIGCSIGQIAKSLVFRTVHSDRPVLVIASGTNRVDEAAVARALSGPLGGEAIGRADADFVRSKTGFAIGGVPPVGHAEPLAVVIDSDLLGYGEIWAAAGTPKAVFSLTPRQLVDMTGGTVAPVATPRG